MTSILLISAFLALFLAALVFFLKRKTFGDYLLATWLIFIAIHMVIEYLQFYNYDHDYPWPWLISINFSFAAFHPVFIFLYILSYVRPERKHFKLLFHALPILVINLILLNTFYLKPDEEKIASFNFAIDGSGYSNPGLELSFYLVICVILAYLIASYWLLRKHTINVRNQFSTLEGVDLRWLKVVLYSTGIILIAAIILEWISNNSDLISPMFSSTVIFIFILLAICYIGIHGIRQSEIFIDSPGLINEEKYTAPAIKEDSFSGTGIIHLDRVDDEKYERLIRFMEDEKPYLDYELNLPGLSKKLGFKSHYLSQLINQKSRKNFFDFVNTYRVNEFKKRARQPDCRLYTLLSLAYDCGFNSKTTFNRVFKNHTGHTPSEFFNNHNIS